MIQTTFICYRDNLESAKLTGHAGSGEYGFDVACVTVLVLSINLVNSLEALADYNADLAVNEIDGGYTKIDISHVTKKIDEKVQLLFESFPLGMTNLAGNSQEFVSIQVIAN